MLAFRRYCGRDYFVYFTLLLARAIWGDMALIYMYQI